MGWLQTYHWYVTVVVRESTRILHVAYISCEVVLHWFHCFNFQLLCFHSCRRHLQACKPGSPFPFVEEDVGILNKHLVFGNWCHLYNGFWGTITKVLEKKKTQKILLPSLIVKLVKRHWADVDSLRHIAKAWVKLQESRSSSIIQEPRSSWGLGSAYLTCRYANLKSEALAHVKLLI